MIEGNSTSGGPIEAETAAMLRATLTLFGRWRLTDAQARVLLGQPSASTYERWRRGETEAVIRSSAVNKVQRVAKQRNACGRLCAHRRRINVSTVLAGQRLGVKRVNDGIWIVSFMHFDLGYLDLE